jgi:hypothetical protein
MQLSGGDQKGANMAEFSGFVELQDRRLVEMAGALQAVHLGEHDTLVLMSSEVLGTEERAKLAAMRPPKRSLAKGGV